MGTYVCIKPSITSIMEFKRFFKKVVPPFEPNFSNYHCTMMLSNDNCEYDILMNAIGIISNVSGKITKFEQVGDGSVVGWLESESIHALHRKINNHLSWDSEFDYNPHVTVFLSKNDMSDWCEQANEVLKTNSLIVNFIGMQIGGLKNV
jgi:hypothetical protein